MANNDPIKSVLRPIMKLKRERARACKKGCASMVWFIIAGLILAFLLWALASASMSEDMGGRLTKQLEGYRSTPYQCSEGYKTIGYGFNIESAPVKGMIDEAVLSGRRPLRRDEADKIFDHLYEKARHDARRFVGNETYKKLNREQRAILNDMAYNLGARRLSRFRNMRAAIIRGDDAAVVREMKDSKWFSQVGRNRSSHHVSNWGSS